MDKELLKKISEECGSNSVQIPLKVPQKLDALIEHEISLNANEKIKKAEFIRRGLYLYFLPEILQARLYSKATDWVTKSDFEDKSPINFQIQKRIKDLEQIGEEVKTAIQLTRELDERVIQAEVDYLNELSRRLSISFKNKKEVDNPQ